MNEILEMSREIDYYNSIYKFKYPTKAIRFTKFGIPMYTFDRLKIGEKKLQKVEKEQEDFKKDLNEITSGNPKHKTENQLYTIKNAKNLYYSIQKIIDLLNDNSKIRSEAIYKASKKTAGTGLKILTPKHMIQRLPTALVQVKGGNNSKRLLNEIRLVLCISQNKSLKRYTIT